MQAEQKTPSTSGASTQTTPSTSGTTAQKTPSDKSGSGSTNGVLGQSIPGENAAAGSNVAAEGSGSPPVGDSTTTASPAARSAGRMSDMVFLAVAMLATVLLTAGRRD